MINYSPNTKEVKLLIRLLLLTLLFFPQGVLASELLAPAEFARLYLEQVKQTYPQVQGEIVDEFEVSVKIADGEEFTSYLDNAFREYKSNPDAITDILQKHVQSLEQIFASKDAEKNRDSLVPVIKHYQYLEETNAFLLQKNSDPEIDNQLYYEPLNSELVVLYAFDSEKSLSFASRAQIAEIGETPEGLRSFAIANLRNILPGISRQGDESLSMLIADGNFEASLLLFDEIWTKQNFNVAGDIVVFVPTRDLVLVTGSQDKAGVERAREIIRNNDWPYLISIHGFVRQNGAWVQFDR